MSRRLSSFCSKTAAHAKCSSWRHPGNSARKLNRHQRAKNTRDTGKTVAMQVMAAEASARHEGDRLRAKWVAHLRRAATDARGDQLTLWPRTGGRRSALARQALIAANWAIACRPSLRGRSWRRRRSAVALEASSGGKTLNAASNRLFIEMKHRRQAALK